MTAGLALGAHFADLAPDLRRDPRIATLRALAGISLMPTGQPTTFEDRLDKLKSCAASKSLPDPVTPEFVAAVQEALSGLEKIVVSPAMTSRRRGSPATPEDLRRRFDAFMNERCKGKDAGKLRFVVE